MKLESVKLTNFRGFRELEISFDPSFTVLLGENMAGKTAVLDGIAVALGEFFRSSGVIVLRNIEDDDIHQIVTTADDVPDLHRCFPVRAEARVLREGSGAPIIFAQVRGESSPETYADGMVDRGLASVGRAITDLPIIAHYGTSRSWPRRLPASELRGIGSRFDAYIDCLNITSAHGFFADWMRKQTQIQVQHQVQRGTGYTQPQLAVIEAAILSCIKDVSRFWYDLQYDELSLERSDGSIQRFSLLSEGVRNMVAMIADIALRCAVLNPKHGSHAHELTRGLVFIDELELHLHPAWQRRIVDDLRRTFPNIQFIVTTHSPQIVASVTRQQIRLLDRNRLVADEAYVQGRSSNEILTDVFGVPERPADAEAEIHALNQLIDDGDFSAARARLNELEQRLGPQDTAIVRARWLLDLEQGSESADPPPA